MSYHLMPAVMALIAGAAFLLPHLLQLAFDRDTSKSFDERTNVRSWPVLLMTLVTMIIAYFMPQSGDLSNLATAIHYVMNYSANQKALMRTVSEAAHPKALAGGLPVSAARFQDEILDHLMSAIPKISFQQTRKNLDESRRSIFDLSA